MTDKSFQEQLKHYTQIVFDNHRKFMDTFNAGAFKNWTLYCFYMSGSQCFYQLEHDDNFSISDELHIKTSEFLEWADGLQEGEDDEH